MQNMYAGEWDAGDMGCGELLIHLSMRMKQLQPGQLFKLTALAPGLERSETANAGHFPTVSA